MADYIEVDITTLEQDIEALKEAVGLVRGDMASMFGTISELDAMWDGPANAAFNMQFDRDRQTLEALCGTVDDIIDSVENAKNSYRKCETAVRDEINKIKI